MSKGSFSITIHLLLVAVVLLTGSSCGAFKKAPKNDKVYDHNDELDEIRGRRVYNPETGQYEIIADVTEKLDTVRWKENSIEKFPLITSDSKPLDSPVVTPNTTKPDKILNTGGTLKAEYNLAFALPFFTNLVDSAGNASPNSMWAIHFYAGAQIALDKLQTEGVYLKVSVHDTQGSEPEVKKLMDSNADLKNADLIIGPYRRENITMIADWVKGSNRILVSPYSATTGLSPKNPNYVQVNPSLETHCREITRFVRKRYGIEEVVLVAREKEKLRFEYFQEANFEVEGTRKVEKFKELVFADNFSGIFADKIKPFLHPVKTTVFIVPSWSDEAFITNFLKGVEGVKGTSSVIVFGMPQWMDFEKMDYDLYEKSNLHISSAQFVEANDLATRNFKQEYFNRFGVVPSEAAFSGYDVTLYFGRMLKKYGTAFQKNLELEAGSYLQRKFKIEPTVAPMPQGAEGKPVIEQYENKAVFILRFKNFQFQKAN